MANFLRFCWLFSLVLICVHCDDVDILDDGSIVTTRNTEVIMEMDLSVSSTISECLLISPQGETFQILPSAMFNVTISNLSPILSTCGVKITDMNIELQGEWIFRATANPLGFKPTNSQQTFKLAIEEYVDATPSNEISTYIGEDVYIQLSNLPNNVHTCVIKTESLTSEMRAGVSIHQNCSFSIQQVPERYSGVWTFGAIGDYTVLTNITLNVKDYPVMDGDKNMNVLYNFPAVMEMGPEDTVFCKTIDPFGIEYTFNGKCSLNIDRVTYGHAGVWKTFIGLNNAVQTLEYNYNVSVLDSTNVPHPTTVKHTVDLKTDRTLLTMTCTLVTEMKGCRMIRSDGTTFIMSHGIGNGRYSFYGNGIYEDSNGNIISECGIQIENPDDEDLKRWQCIIVKSDDTEAGSIIAVTSFEYEENSNSTTSSEDNSSTIISHLGNTLILRCNQDEKMDYCWMLSPNRTIYRVHEGLSTDEYEYIGQGLSLGDCGIKIHNARKEHAGAWKCNVGVESGIDLQHNIRVTVHDSLVVSVFKNYYLAERPTIGCQTYDNSPVEYCRFIRSDGVGINPSKIISSKYSGNSTDLSKGLCFLTIAYPTFQDVGSWICVAKPFEQLEQLDSLRVHYYWYYYPRATPSSILAIALYISLTIGLFCLIYSICTRATVVKKYTNRVRESIRKRKTSSDL